MSNLRIKLIDFWTQNPAYKSTNLDIKDSFDCLDVALMHPRSARNIRIVYDFERDGWSISACSDMTDVDSWEEKAFIPAWEIID